jgi:mono/diheme cytochrome c family protein
LSARRAALAAASAFAFALCLAAATRPAQAIPIFAQRYNMQCGACHSVLPELNQFGNEFRNRGYRLDGAPKHGTTVVALREQVGYTPTPTDGTTRKTVPAGAALGALEVGRVEAFVHETLGSEGSSASLFLGYLAYRDAHSGVLYRAGLVELPLVHSPAQRNDTLTTYGYEGTLVGLNDLTLATPRWALEAERDVGTARVAATLAFGNATGSAYGGKPVETGRSESFAAPELGVFARFPITGDVRVGIDALAGSRSIAVLGRPAFSDPYRRVGTSLEARRGRLELLAQQWWGRDNDADGAGGIIDSDGGFVRLRWRLGQHAFVGVREDGAAAPAATRTLLWYAEGHVTPHARVLIQQRRPIPGGPTSLEAALTVGIPWPRGK